MTSLAQLQTDLQRSIRNAEKFTGAVSAVGVDSATRVEIYITAYRLRLIEALAANFPRLQKLLGNDAFAAMAETYLDRFPSTNVSVRWFGHRLADFLREDPALAAMPWIAELAQWEWEIAAAFDATDATPIELPALNIAPELWPDLRFTLHPSVRLPRLRTNAVSLFSALSEEATELPAPQLLDESRAYVIWRQGLDVRFRPQDDDEAHALNSVRNDATFEAMCDGLCDWHAEDAVPVRAASLLKTWVVEGLIAAIVTSE